jgi:hypothetical protein
MRFNTSQAKELYQLALYSDVIFDKMYKRLEKNGRRDDPLFYQGKFQEASQHIHKPRKKIREEFEIRSVVPKLEKYHN